MASFFHRVPAVLALFGALACGSDGLYRAGVIGGDEATDRITDAVSAGIGVCQQRINPSLAANADYILTLTLGREFERQRIQNFYGLDDGRGYKQGDVDDCAQRITTAFSLGSDCSANALPACFMDPVNRYTGN